MSIIYMGLSGGADSTTMLAYLLDKGHKVRPIFFDYGQRHIREEISAQQVCDHYQLEYHMCELQVAQTGALAGSQPTPSHADVVGHPQPPTYVPMRNLIIAATLSSFAEPDKGAIALGVHRSDTYGYWDTSPEFILRLQAILALSRDHVVTVMAPFKLMTKTSIIKLGLELKVPYSLTWSCYAGQEVACGVCSTCVERRASFKKCGVEDPITYAPVGSALG